MRVDAPLSTDWLESRLSRVVPLTVPDELSPRVDPRTVPDDEPSLDEPRELSLVDDPPSRLLPRDGVVASVPERVVLRPEASRVVPLPRAPVSRDVSVPRPTASRLVPRSTASRPVPRPAASRLVPR